MSALADEESSISKRKRSSKACDACHKRKTKCTGGFPCQSCQIRKVTCTFSHQRKKGNDYMTNLQKQIENVTKLLETNIQLETLHSTRALLSLQEMNQPKTASNFDLFASVSTPYTIDSEPIHYDWIDYYFHNLYSLLPIIHHQTFYQELSPHKQPFSFAFQFLLNCIYTFSLHHAQSQKDMGLETLDKATEYFNKAQRVLPLLMGQDSIHIIQGLLMICLVAAIRGSMSMAWSFLGMAARMCLALKMNHDSEELKEFSVNKISWVAAEERRRTFWLTFLIDRILSSVTSLPFAINEADIHASLPVDISLFLKQYTERDTYPSKSEIHLSDFQLKLGLNQICPLSFNLLFYHLFSKASHAINKVKEKSFDLHSLPKDEFDVEVCFKTLLITYQSMPNDMKDLNLLTQAFTIQDYYRVENLIIYHISRMIITCPVITNGDISKIHLISPTNYQYCQESAQILVLLIKKLQIVNPKFKLLSPQGALGFFYSALFHLNIIAYSIQPEQINRAKENFKTLFYAILYLSNIWLTLNRYTISILKLLTIESVSSKMQDVQLPSLSDLNGLQHSDSQQSLNSLTRSDSQYSVNGEQLQQQEDSTKNGYLWDVHDLLSPKDL